MGKYEDLFEKWVEEESWKSALDFAKYLDQRRDEKKARKIKDEGWIKWEAKPDSVCPVDGNTRILCVLHCGNYIVGLANELVWTTVLSATIVKYRIIKDA